MRSFNKKQYILSAFFLVFISITSFAQERELRKLTPEKRNKVGSKMVSGGSYYNAVEHMEALVKEHPDNKEYLMRLAEAYFFSRDYKNAEIWFKRLVDKEEKPGVAHFRYAETLKYNAKYAEAKQEFQKFASSKYTDKKGESFKLFAKNEIGSCAYALEQTEALQPFEIVHLGDNVNSKYGDFAPMLWNDTTLIFSSLQSDTVLVVKPEDAHPHTVKLLVSPLQDTIWGPNKPLPTLNTIFENNANGTFSADGKKFYFSRCYQEIEDHKVTCNLYSSTYENGKFSKAKKMSGKINRKGFSTTQAHIAVIQNGKKKTEMLFFASDRPGGKGGMDIYTAIADKNGNFSSISNLGREINTIRDEITPYYDSTSNALFFSSNYHFGFGGYDAFVSNRINNKWTDPKNIGKPVNTRVDDYYYTLRPDRNEGFLVSNRPEGYHLTSETCCDDIYSHILSDSIYIAKIQVFNNKKEKKELSNIQLRLFEKKQLESENNLPAFFKAGDTLPKQGNSKLMVLTADSARTMNRKNIVSTFKKPNGKIESASPNNLIAGNRYKELPSAENSYLVHADREYLAAAIIQKDTVYFLVKTDAENRLKSTLAQDSASADWNELQARDFRLLTVNLYYNKAIDSTLLKKAAAAEKTKSESTANIENEKSNTVSRAFRDLQNQKNKDLKIILNYDFDDTKFIEKHSGSLDSLAILMKKYPKLNILIAAHTDSKGSDEYNQKLSKARAKSIVDYLDKKDISTKRMRSKGFGETQPLVPNENPDGSDNPDNRWLNRRAEITILKE